MLKFIIAFERNAALTRAACHEYMIGNHGPLVASVPEFARHVRRYVQNHALAAPLADRASDFDADGAAELWYDDMLSFERAFSEPRYLAEIRPDELRFVNPERLVVAFTEEETALDRGGAPTVKLFRFIAAPQGADLAAFRRDWTKHAAAPSFGRGVSRAVLNWSGPPEESPFPQANPVACVLELWFENEAALGDWRAAGHAAVPGSIVVEFAAREREMHGFL